MPAVLMLLIFGAIFLVVVLFFGFCFALHKSKQNNQIRAMLRTADPAVAERSMELLRPNKLGDRVSRFLEDIGLSARLNRILDQAGSEWSSTRLVMISVAGTLAGLLLGSRIPAFSYKLPILVCAGALGGSLPLLLVKRQRTRRLRLFEEQFPEALDFLSRSLRAGHAFTVGLEMLVVDAPDPLATIFRRVLQDLQLGASLETAFQKLLETVPLVDVRFFASSVLLQQETGGNLSEILNKLSDVIRDRFRVKGQVRAAAAHGKVTGLVLLLLPVVVAGLMFFASPGYLNILFTDPDGRLLVLGAVVGQALGFICIKKITDIKV